MGFADISDPDAVRRAINECESVGEVEFLQRHGFGPTRHVRLFYEGKDYPAKAILGVAHGYQFPDDGPLSSSSFTSGDSTIRKLQALGFDARSTNTPAAQVFVVRGGDDERIVPYALRENVVACGWSQLGDLNDIADEELESAIRLTYPDVMPDTQRSWAAIIRAFKSITLGDRVILPMTSKRQFAVGVVAGSYEHRATNEDQATNCYPVDWLATDLSRTLLGDLRTRVDLPPTVHRIAVDGAAELIDRMIELRQPITLSQHSETTVQATFAAILDAVARKDQPRIVVLVGRDGERAVTSLLESRRPISSGTGQSTPAEVPWISVYPREASASAKQGIYAVYLFAADGSAVYLSFNQGTENVAGGLPPLKKRALDMRRAAELNDAGDPIDLRSSAGRPRKYEAGNAYAIRYDRDEIPGDDALKDDLSTVLGYVDRALEAGLVFDPTREPTHVLFKWSAEINPHTLDEHRAIAEAQGSTWWGRIGTASMATSRIQALQSQLQDGVATHVYLYGQKGLVRTRLREVATDPQLIDEALKPDFFDKSDCTFFARISDFETLDAGWALANLVLASDPNPENVSGALSNQTTPLFVFERFATASDPEKPELDLSWLKRETLWDEAALKELLEALDPATGKGQVILAGPPGTGKTWVGERVARFLTQDEPLKRRTVQFHPSYGYEEFVEGIRPKATEHGISFEPVKGTVLRMAEGIDSDDIHVLVIDEINRANIPRVFGELLYLLEYRDQDMELQYSASFRLPSNLRFIATMNTADRSVRSIDVALRRRFEVFECAADAAVLERYYELPGHTTSVVGLVEGFTKLNAELEKRLDRHHTIGQSFFMASAYDRPRLERTWRRQVLPLIEDYFFDQPDVVEQFTLDGFWPAAN